MIHRDEIIWAAGLFEGDGSVRINRPTKHNLGALMVAITSTDRDIPEWFQSRWPGHCKSVSTSEDRKPAWGWVVPAIKAKGFLVSIRPFVKSKRMQIRIDLGIEFQWQKITRGKGNRTEEYRLRQWAYYERMIELNGRKPKLPLVRP